MAKTTHGLPETKGFFRLRGLATGLKKEDALKSHTFTSGSEKNTAKFGVKVDQESIVFINAEGFKTKEAHLFKQSEVKGEKSQKKVVPWDDRYNHEDEGFKVIGTRLGLEKDEKGKNIISTFAQYDAPEALISGLSDDTSIYVQGKIEYSSFKNRDGDAIRNKKLLADAVFLNSKDIDFEEDGFESLSDFKQTIVFIGIEKAESGDKFLVEAKIITQNSIENAEFVIYEKSLANMIKKNLKPYTSIDVSGKIINKADVEEVKETDSWGKTNSFDRANTSYTREYVIEGANPETIDVETYTQSIVDEALEKLNAKGQQKSSDNWGKQDSNSEKKGVEVEEEDLPW
ncbi:hypothetical protein [Lysinibacillus sp. NPDC086135]|uniref:hypothetical protein n=1 Tax=Lysinibacillus sp. NPDC086135 TaxID=3364130 RepID=UPI00381C843E